MVSTVLAVVDTDDQRVQLVVSSEGLRCGAPWTVTVDGRPVAYCSDRATAVQTLGLLREAVER